MICFVLPGAMGWSRGRKSLWPQQTVLFFLRFSFTTTRIFSPPAAGQTFWRKKSSSKGLFISEENIKGSFLCSSEIYIYIYF